jgi:Cu-Zn family superoxide dismutase
LPNIEVDQNGKVDVKVVAPLVTLEEGKENSLFDEDGSALMIHEKADDNKTNPAGDAGSRIACGVIQK